MAFRILILDTKSSNPNHYIGLAIADALRRHPLTESVITANYGNALHLARQHACNLFFAWDGEEINAALCERLAQKCGKSVLWVTEDPYELDRNLERAQYFDFVFTNDSASVEAYQGKAVHLPFAASEMLHYREISTDESRYRYDVLFVGTAWPNRVQFLRQLLLQRPNLKYKIGLTGNEHLPEPDLPLPKSEYDWRVPNTELCRLASKSRVVLTLHRAFSASNNPVSAATPGPRLFETALAGGFQLIDMSQPEVASLYEKDKEFFGFSTMDEVVSEIDWALSHPEQRREIALAAQRRTRREHLYKHRVDRILTHVSQSPDHRPVKRFLATKPRVLFIGHNTVQSQPFGGVEVYQDLLRKELAETYDVYIYSPLRKEDGTQEYILLGPDGAIAERFLMTDAVNNDVLSEPNREKCFSAILDKYDFSLIHVHHLLYHPLSLPYLARAFGIPLVVTFHDYYLLCKRINFLDYRGVYCSAGHCTDSTCETCMEATGFSADEKVRWNAFAGAMLDMFDRYIVSVHCVADLISSTYPQILASGRTVILPLPTRKLSGGLKAVDESAVLKVAIPGNFTHPKGAEVLLPMFAAMRDDPVVFHILGRVDEPYGGQLQLLNLDNVVVHGPYLPEEMDSLLAKMNVALILSIWPETYVFTLSETWNNNIVPIVSDIGALGERVTDGVNGFKVQRNNVMDVVGRLRLLINNPPLLRDMQRNIAEGNLFPDVAEHIGEIRKIYDSLILTKPLHVPLPGRPPCSMTLRDCGVIINAEKPPCSLPAVLQKSGVLMKAARLFKRGVTSVRIYGVNTTLRKTIKFIRKRI